MTSEPKGVLVVLALICSHLSYPGARIPTWSWHQIRQPHIREYEAGESGANFTLVARMMFRVYSS